MATWNQLPIPQQTRREMISYFDLLGGAADHASVAGTVVEHMRKKGWRYTPSAQSVVAAFAAKRINCDTLSDLLAYFYAYKNHPNNVVISVAQVHQANAPVFLPKSKIQRTGLKIALNVNGYVQGVFFNTGHRVPSLAGVCYDLISGNQGSKVAMERAYIRCNKIQAAPNEVYQFNYLAGGSIRMTKQPGRTVNGLSKYSGALG